MSRRLSITLVVALALALCTTSPASATTTTDAGRYYLAVTCPLNSANFAVDRALFRGKRSVTAKQVHGKRLRQTRRALLALERRDAAVSRALAHPPSAWPTTGSAQATSSLAQALVRESRIIDALRQGKARQRFANYWNTWFVPQSRTVYAAINAARAQLGLGPNGRGC